MPTRTALAFILALAAPAALASEGHAAHGSPAAVQGPSADAALKELKQGNARFTKGKLLTPRVNPARLAATAKGQQPKAIVLGCSDSRVPPEYIFDQGVGDLFVVRVAGNVSEPYTLGSIEYAAEHLNVPLVVVLGHRSCGAVKATVDGAGTDGNIGALVKEIQPAVAAVPTPGPEGKVDGVVRAHARRVAAELTQESPVLKHLADEGKVKIVVGIYDLATGKVEFE
jgi:carbonic anhydrase